MDVARDVDSNAMAVVVAMSAADDLRRAACTWLPSDRA
jgi:hypothetical protein